MFETKINKVNSYFEQGMIHQIQSLSDRKHLTSIDLIHAMFVSSISNDDLSFTGYRNEFTFLRLTLYG
jgi:hypothetical protein